MSAPHLGSPVRIAAAVFMSILLVGCGKAEPPGPHVDQAGHLLRVQFYKLLFATSTADVQITDALYDKYLPCGGGKVKLTYVTSGKAMKFAATSTAAVSKTKAKAAASPSKIIDDLVRYLPTVGTFSITERRSEDATVKLVNAKTNTRLTLHSPAPGRLTISGETDCLRPGPPAHH